MERTSVAHLVCVRPLRASPVKNPSLLLYIAVPLIAGCAVREPSAWQTIDAGPFTFQAPATMRRVPSEGVDSDVAEFRDRNIHLSFDFGSYSNNLSGWPPSTITVKTAIDGRPARIGTVAHSFGHRFPHSTGVYIADVWGAETPPEDFPAHLHMFASCRTSADCLVAQRIFRSLRFAPEPK